MSMISIRLLQFIFADDTKLFLPNEDINKYSMVWMVSWKKMSIWFKANKLSLNLTKMRWKLFHLQKKKCLYFANFEIVRKSITKFLGIFIDKYLTWKYHIEHVCNQLPKSIVIMKKSKNILCKRLMKQLYFSFIHS